MNRTSVDALARLLDGGPAPSGEVTEELCALGDLAQVLHARALEPRPEFKADLRAALIAAAREQVPAAPPGLARLRERIQGTTARWRYSTRVAAATGATALALSGGGVSVAAERSLPSDALYPAKLVLENVRIALVRDGIGRGDARLAQVESRLDEVETVAVSGDQAGAALALREADESARAGAGELIQAYQAERQPGSVRQLAAFVQEQRARLLDLDTLLAGDAAEAARVLSIGLERIEARALAVAGNCPSCAGGGPGPGVGFDFSAIPPADHPFMACPCEYRSQGSDPALLRPPRPDPGPDPDPPAADPAPPEPTQAPAAEDRPPEQPTVGIEPPEPAEVLPPTQRPRPLLDLREPLRDTTDGLLDGVLDDLLDKTTDTVDGLTDNLLGD